MLASTAVAATANINIGGGTDFTTKPRAATPTTVSPNDVAGFYLWIQNADAANLSSFFMNAATDSPAVGGYWYRRSAPATRVNCPVDSNLHLMCSFGPFNSGDEIVIVAAFNAKPSANNCMTNNPPPNSGGYAAPTTSHACVDFQFGADSGFVPPKPGKPGNNSRGDAYHWFDFVGTDINQTDAAAPFPFCNLATQTTATCAAGLLTIANGASVNRNNVQATQLTAPRGAFDSLHGSTGLAVTDNFVFSCPAGLTDCASHQGSGSSAFVGQWSQLDVNSEQDFGDEFIQVKLTMYGVSPNSVDGLVHLYSDGAGGWLEGDPITAPCPSVDGPAVDQTTECFWASGSGNVTTVLVWMHDNGRARTF
jgi:hypothetical protein